LYLGCLLDSCAEVSLIDHKVLTAVDTKSYALEKNKETLTGIQRTAFPFVGTVKIKIDSGVTVCFVVSKDLVHEMVLGIDVLETAKLDLSRGLVAIPELRFEGKLDRGSVGRIFFFETLNAAELKLDELQSRYAELFGPYPVGLDKTEQITMRLSGYLSDGCLNGRKRLFMSN
jgi:hypothetical protein